MKPNILVLFLLFVNVLHGADIAITLDPTKIRAVKGTWQRNGGEFAGEKYLDYVDEDNNILFHALESRAAASINCFIRAAKDTRSLLVYKNPRCVFFCDTGEVLKAFKLEPKKANAKKENFLIVDPQLLTLNTFMNGDAIKYFVSINGDVKKETAIEKSVFDMLLLAKNFAEETGQDLKINFHKLHRPGQNPANGVLFVKKVPQGSECVVCQDKAKDTVLMPCKHLCVCQECGEKITDACPLCRTKIKEKIKVY